MSLKKSFKIFLDSNNASSYTGGLYNATYSINLNTIITNSADLNKYYYMYCSFLSQVNDITVNSINPSNVYTLHIDMGKGLNIYQFRSTKCPSFILPTEVMLSTIGVAADADTRFNLQEFNQRPTLIPNILNLNTITLNVINTTTNATFTGNADYICVLTFVEC
jgi:hypothetical protein